MEKRGWKGAHFERERRLLSCLRREGLGEPEELLELELRDVLELPERLEAEDELEPLLEPVLVLEPELEVELDRDLRGKRKGSRAGAVLPHSRQEELLGSYSQASWLSPAPTDTLQPRPNKVLAGTETAFVPCSDRTASYLRRSLAYWEEKEPSGKSEPRLSLEGSY